MSNAKIAGVEDENHKEKIGYQDDYVPLLDRMGAWWNSGDNGKLTETSKDNDKSKNIIIDSNDFELDAWSEKRIQILEILWGRGTRIPGSDAFNKTLFKPKTLNSKSKILDISAGFGSCARMMAKETFASVDVIEKEASLTSHLRIVNSEEKLNRFITVLNGDLTDVNLNKNKYNLIYGREALFKVKNKQNILEKCVDSLCTGGQINFTDFVLEKDASSYRIFKNWSKREVGTVYPISIGVLKKIFQGFDMRLIEPVDYSKQYIHFVNQGWTRLKKYLENNDFDDDFVNIMVQESDLWLSRVRALQSGKLKLMHFRAFL